MAPLLTEEESALDPYALLSVTSSSSEKEIRKAYRQQSLKYHPDRNQSAEAPAKFREISLSLEILLDVAKRNWVDNKRAEEARRKEKYAELDKKRKVMVDALNAREEDAKKAKVEAVKRRQQAAEEEEIKEAGRRMVLEAQKRAAAAAASSSSASLDPSLGTAGPSRTNGDTTTATATDDPQPSMGPEDLTLILQFPSSSTLPATTPTLQPVLEGRYGPINHLVISEPPESAAAGTKKKRKGRKAVVEFKQGNWGGCWACWKDHLESESSNGTNGTRDGRAGGGGKRLEDGVKARWAKGETPAWVAWADRQRQSTSNGSSVPRQSNGNGNGHAPSPTFSFASAPNLTSTTMDDLLAAQNGRKEQRKREEEFESMTLFRMRQAERDRLAEEIRRQEEAEV